ncbi:MAG TPA: hypothetical protein VHR55_04575 [Candidatus Limnocylindria bacterium]|nr:hypothetical protein [Candidatus Limnocylindria bacterium]
MLRTLSTAAILLMVIACAQPPDPWPVDPSAIADPARMVVEPPTAIAGDEVKLHFPEGGDRGVLFALDAPSGGTWERRAYLLSDANGGEPTAHGAGEEMIVEMVGIAGPGPDTVVLPSAIAPGAYRICTANAAQNLCAPITIEDR